VNSFGLNIYDLLYHDHLVLSRSAAEEIDRLLGSRKEGEEVAPVEDAPADEAPAKPKRARKPKKEEAA